MPHRRAFVRSLIAGVSVAPRLLGSWSDEPNHQKYAQKKNGFELWTGGLNNDIISIQLNGVELVFDAVRDGNFHKVVIGAHAFALIHGDKFKRDVATLYGLWLNGNRWEVEICYFPARDGAFEAGIGPTSTAEDIFNFEYGRNRDLRRKLCWRGGLGDSKWHESPQTVRAYEHCTLEVPIGTPSSIPGLPANDLRVTPANSPRTIMPRR